MPILIHSANGPVVAHAAAFDSEEELEKVIASQPNLLESEDEEPLAFVARQVTLPDAGCLDLLFVSEIGLPVAVEVKLARNGESRRQVVAQIVDYVSALTGLTVDELDQRVNGLLETALRSFDLDADTDEFDRRWQAVGANLRAGFARVVVVLDDVPPDLERIVRFLSEHSNLDVRLVTISRYGTQKIGTLDVPRIVISAQGDRTPPRPEPRPPRLELAEVIKAYDSVATSDIQTRGNAGNYRQIRFPEWPAGFKVHYEFVHKHGQLGVELHLENDRAAASLSTLLKEMAGRKVGPNQDELQWDPQWSHGRGRLIVRYPLTEPSNAIAQSMLALIQLTREPVAKQTSELSVRPMVSA